MRRYIITPVVLFSFLGSLAVVWARQDGQAPPEVDSTLWRVLEFWEARSSKIERLRGDVVRRVYDTKWEVETIGQGLLYFEAPDKGRLDVLPVEINKKLLAARAKKGRRAVRQAKNGDPYRLVSAHGERWICDGQRLISTDEDKKSVDIVALPEELQGQNIMNGPLPFLFGLPPDEAIDRFHLELVAAPTEENPIARIKAIPKRRDDQQNWREATILLDTRTGLPTHVQLKAPGGTKEEVYSFDNMKKNQRTIPEIFGRNPFHINLRSYTRNIIEDGNASPQPRQEAALRQPPQNNGIKPDQMPNLVGMVHTDAKAELVRRGLDEQNIKLNRGPRAQRKGDVYRVQQQDPAPGTPLERVDVATLMLWTK